MTLKVSEMESIPDATMDQCVGYVGGILEDSCKDNKRLCKKVWQKVRITQGHSKLNLVLHHLLHNQLLRGLNPKALDDFSFQIKMNWY